mgnify:CR=1 FL=1
MDIKHEIQRIKKGMEMVDSRIDKNGNEMTEDSFNKHMEHLQKLMREVSEEGTRQSVKWEELV